MPASKQSLHIYCAPTLFRSYCETNQAVLDPIQQVLAPTFTSAASRHGKGRSPPSPLLGIQSSPVARHILSAATAAYEHKSAAVIQRAAWQAERCSPQRLIGVLCNLTVLLY